jgi:hypothetical protein
MPDPHRSLHAGIRAGILAVCTVLPAQGGPIDWEAARQHWAFRPLPGAVPVPAVADEAWPRDPLDRFVLARLEAEGLRPGADTDQRTWIRRVSFDLTGLPPGLDEVEAFVADTSADAREKVVDRLLASPAYAEHAARRWLDLVRYADSNGLDENLAFADAWRYRDWVVDAFDRDLPYQDFLTMQIAGDLLPATEDERLHIDRLRATGFWSLGPKMLAEQDKPKLRIDIVDEQLDVLTKATLGLTVSCARCHDHKFDPVSQRDYYALAGILHSTSTMEDLGFVSRWREVELATPAQRAAREAWVEASTALDAEIQAESAAAERALEATLAQDLGRYLLAGEAAARRAVYVEAEAMAAGNLRIDDAQWGSPATRIVHTGSAGLQWAEWDLEVPAGGGPYELQVRFAAKESRPVRLWLDGEPLAERALAETSGDWFPAAQRWFTVASPDLAAGTHRLRLERDGAIPHLDKWCLWPVRDGEDGGADPGLAPELVRAAADFLAHPGRAADPLFGVWHAFARLPAAEFGARAAGLADEFMAREPSLAPLARALCAGLPPASLRELAIRYEAMYQVVDRAWRRQLEVHAEVVSRLEDPGLHPPAPGAVADPEQEQLRLAVLGPDGLFGSRRPTQADGFPAAARTRLAALARRRAALDAERPPEYPRALGVVDGEVADLPIHRRGNHLDPAAAPTPRGALQLFDHLLPQPVIPAGTSGRLELAAWICDPRHPLTARVLVNRVWQAHFGQGLVRTPSNFGPRGAAPTHTELLDHLARGFLDCGSSLKALHRRIALSRTYGLSSTGRADTRTADPDDRLLGRFPRRRLPAEAIRDGILAVAGSLDRTRGGSLLGTRDRDYVTNDQSADQARYDAPRRSLYLPLIRNAVYDQFTLFDFNDPSVSLARRPETAVPIQALWLMNSELVHAQALAFARRVLAEVPDDPRARIDRAFRHAYARPATEGEIERTLGFVERTRQDLLAQAGGAVDGASPTTDERAWAALCQVLLAANEFLHVD